MRTLLSVLIFSAAAHAASAANVITSSSVVNHSSDPSYIMELDKSHPFLREHIRSSVDISVDQTGSYRLTADLLKADGTSVLSSNQDFTISGVVPQTGTYTVDLTPVITSPLDPLETYRVRTTLRRFTGVIYASQDSTTETTGRRYIHFTTGSTVDISKNVYSELLGASHARRWAVAPVSSGGLDRFSFTVNYRLHRYDNRDQSAPSSHNIALDYAFQLFDETHSPVALVSGTSTDSVSVPEFDTSGPLKIPAVVTGSSTITFKPTTQLDCVNHSYYVRVVEDQAMKDWATPIATETASKDTSLARLAHYNGTIKFGSINATILEPVGHSFGGSPTTFLPVTLTLASAGAQLNGLPAYTLGGTLPLKLLPNGDAVYDLIANVNVNGPGPVIGSSAGISHSSSNLFVDNGGLFADLTVSLPPGVGYIDSSSPVGTSLYSQELEANDAGLNASLVPLGPVTFSPTTGGFQVSEETKPLRYSGTALQWNVGTGTFTLVGPQVSSIHDPLLDYLAGVSTALANSDKATKRSNDHLYNSVGSSLSSLTIGVSPSGAGTISTTLGLGTTDYVAHHPYGAAIKATSGSVTIANDVINSATSTLSGVANVKVGYNQGCVSCQTASPPITDITMIPAGNTLRVGPNGALHAAGTTTTTSLAWGYDGSGYAHTVNLGTATALAPALLVADTFVPQTAMPEQGHFSILNTGYLLTGSTLTAERPDTAAYAAGSADYPGLNFRAGVLGALTSTSRLGGTPVNYGLKANAKYYTRYGGVNGIHDGGSVSSSTFVYGYPFDFSNIGLSFLDSAVEESRINGNIDFPAPADFTQDFEELKLDCLGDLTGLNPTGGTSKELAYWECDFDVVSARFVRSGGSCTAGTGSYVTSIKTWASHLPGDMLGDVGIASTGDVITPAMGVYDGTRLITSRFALPSRIQIRAALIPGTSDRETYDFSPAQDAYLSAEDPTATGNAGHWNFLGTIDVPFFEDVMLHFHTKATKDDTSSTLHVMGGWPSAGWKIGGKNPFEVAVFDETHVSFPGSGIDAYRATATGSADYRLRAITSWLDVVDFEYEMNWDPTLRSFEAVKIESQDILVLPLAHDIIHLSPGNIELSFGLQYEFAPSINIASAAYNAIDEATGIAESLRGALGNAAYLAFQGGLGSFQDLVGTRVDLLLEPNLDALIEVPVATLMASVEAQFSLGYDVDSREVQRAIQNAFTTGTSITSEVKKLLNGTASALGLIQEISLRLEMVEQTLCACVRTNDAKFNLPSTIQTSDSFTADLFDVLNDAYGPKPTSALESFAGDIAENVAAQLTNALIEAAWAELMEKHGEKIESVEGVLAELLLTVHAIRLELNAGHGDFVDELTDILTAAAGAAGQIEDAMTQAEADVIAIIKELSSAEVSGSLNASLKAELIARIKLSIHDRLFAMSFTADITEALRNFLDDLEARMTLGIDTGFGTLNEMIVDAAVGFLSEIDDAIHELLGDSLDGVMGSAGVNGYAHINGDTLDLLRLDAGFEWNVPEEIRFSGGFEISGYKVLGESIDGSIPIETPEVRIAVPDTELSWLGADLSVSVGCLLSFESSGGIPVPAGVGGSFSVDGGVNFEAFRIRDLSCAVAFGRDNAYFAAEMGLEFGPYELSGGAFFGKTASLAPIELIDPSVADLLDGTTSRFTGAYVFGEAHMPIIGGNCLFEVSAGVGAGAFYFSEGPTYGGKLSAKVRGEALCLVEVEGSVEMIGLKSGATWSYSGEGRIRGECLVAEFDERVRFTWKNGDWDVDY
jgi:hypothetical protein